uniref:Uncharacterized protein n=1 Tax=Ditylenchus dipsaci TaxID=166011 RepID=A0A915DD05_9BILA
MLLLVLLVIAAIAYLAFAKNAAVKEDAGLTTFDVTKKESAYASSTLAGRRNARTSASTATAKIPLGLTESKTREMLEDITTETPRIAAR